MQPKIRAYWVATCQDKQGAVLWRKRCWARSYVIALLDMLAVQFLNISLAIKDITNTSQTVSPLASNFRVSGTAAGNVIHHIVVGIGTNAVALTNYALQTQIGEGTGSGQLSYQAGAQVIPFTSGSTRKFQLTRSFVNNSGASITVQEVAIYAYGSLFDLCLERSLTGGWAVGNGQTLAVTYELSLTV